MRYTLPDDLTSIRAELPITQHRHFFNTGWAGPECRAGIGAQTEMIAWLNTTGISHHAMPRIMELVERVRTKVAAYVHTTPESLVLTRGVVDGMNLVLNGFDWRPGDQIVTTNIEHSGGLVPLYALRDRYNIDIAVAAIENLQDMAEKIDRACTARTRLILLSHVSYNTGARLPLAAIAHAARAREIRVLVDGAQTVGAIPVHLPDLGVDYYAFPGHKWMLGPECTGALYLAPDAEPELRLSHTGYMTATSFDAAGHYTPKTGVRRFEGIDHNPVALAGWDAALDFLGAIGETAIAARLSALSARLKAALAGGDGYTVVTPTAFEDAAGLIGLTLANPDRAPAVVDAVLARGFVIRHVPAPTMLRLSVNFFNTEEEIDALAAALRDAIAGAAGSGTTTLA